MVAKIPMTKKREQALRAELEKLKSEDRPRVIEAIAEAREHGDLKENAEYHAAREQQGFIEGRIRELEHKLSHANVIDVTTLPQNGKVVFGTTVDLEADIKSGLLSNTSPIARALLGKEEGETVEVTIPGGRKMLEIVTVRYEA